MSKVRAKFSVVGIEKFPANYEQVDAEGRTTGYKPVIGHKVRLAPVYEQPAANEKDRGNAVHENRIFGRATPSGSIEMSIMNEEAGSQFEIGQEFYVIFEPAGKARL